MKQIIYVTKSSMYNSSAVNFSGNISWGTAGVLSSVNFVPSSYHAWNKVVHSFGIYELDTQQQLQGENNSLYMYLTQWNLY